MYGEPSNNYDRQQQPAADVKNSEEQTLANEMGLQIVNACTEEIAETLSVE